MIMNLCSTCSTGLSTKATVSCLQQNCSQFGRLAKIRNPALTEFDLLCFLSLPSRIRNATLARNSNPFNSQPFERWSFLSSKSKMDFDRFAETYEREVESATRFVAPAGFFLEVKVAHLLGMLRQKFEDFRRLRVLDVGCGVGLADQLLKAHLPIWSGRYIGQVS